MKPVQDLITKKTRRAITPKVVKQVASEQLQDQLPLGLQGQNDLIPSPSEPIPDFAPLSNHSLISPTLITPPKDRKLEMLRVKIEEKKQRFRELALSDLGLCEERLDLDKALKRMDKLLELPSSSLLDKLHEHDQEIFHAYFDSVMNLLDLNPRELNYILASTPIPAEKDVLMKICNNQSKIQGLEESEAKKLFLSFLPRWNIETNNFQVNQDNYFYLPGLPIVIRKIGLPESMKNSFSHCKEKTLSTSEIEKLLLASNLIVKSRWREAMDTSLQLTESVHIVDGMDSAGKAGFLGHTLINIQDDTNEYELAKTIIHEDDHHALRNNKKFESVLYYEISNKTPLINHPWVSSGSRAILIEELFTHQADVLFEHRLLSKGLVEQSKIPEETGSILVDVQYAKQAIEVLEKEAQYLNEDGKYLLNEAKEFWYGFERAYIKPNIQGLPS